jgi:hypothetical protein
MAERKFPRSNIPSFILIRFYPLKLKLVNVVCNYALIFGIMACEHLVYFTLSHFIPFKMRYLKHYVIPLAWFQVLDEMGSSGGGGVISGSLVFDVQKKAIGHHGCGMNIHPEGKPVECRPVLRSVELLQY